jgi:hypothetical protein
MKLNVGLFVQIRTTDVTRAIKKPVRVEQAFTIIRSGRDYLKNHHPSGGNGHINSGIFAISDSVCCNGSKIS